MRLFACLFVFLSVCVSACLCVCVSIRLPVCLLISLSRLHTKTIIMLRIVRAKDNTYTRMHHFPIPKSLGEITRFTCPSPVLSSLLPSVNPSVRLSVRVHLTVPPVDCLSSYTPRSFFVVRGSFVLYWTPFTTRPILISRNKYEQWRRKQLKESFVRRRPLNSRRAESLNRIWWCIYLADEDEFYY